MVQRCSGLRGSSHCNSARLSYPLDGQQNRDIPLQVRTRGTWRLRRDICTIPPLFLVFPQEQTEGTLFAGQDLLPLTTHCSSKYGRHDNYVLKEYLAYRIYQLFSEKSIRVRDKRMRVFELIELTPGLSKRAQNSTVKYLKDFFEILDSPKKRKKMIVDACR